MNQVIFRLPLQAGDPINFVINGTTYNGRVETLGTNRWFIRLCNVIVNGKPEGDSHTRLTMALFKSLGTDPKSYYKKVLGERFLPDGVWPETNLEVLIEVLNAMKTDIKSHNVIKYIDKIDLSKFRFRQGDIILFDDKPCTVVGYHFSAGFNNYKCQYGYVIDSKEGGHDGHDFGYDAYGDRLTHNARYDLWYIYEAEAKEYKQKSNLLTTEKSTKNGNAFKLQRNEAVISRGKVLEGCRIRCKIYKASISVQSLGYAKIARGSEEPTS